jgi:hypothetical protein
MWPFRKKVKPTPPRVEYVIPTQKQRMVLCILRDAMTSAPQNAHWEAKREYWEYLTGVTIGKNISDGWLLELEQSTTLVRIKCTEVKP